MDQFQSIDKKINIGKSYASECNSMTQSERTKAIVKQFVEE